MIPSVEDPWMDTTYVFSYPEMSHEFQRYIPSFVREQFARCHFG